MLSCTAQGAECLGSCGQVKDLACSGGPVWLSVAKLKGVVSVLLVPELLQPQHLLHSGSSWTLGRLSRASSCSHPGSGGVCSHTQPSCVKERPLPPGLQTPSSPLGQPFQPSQQPGFLLTITSPWCPAAPGRQGWLLTTETCSPRSCSAQNAHSFVLITDGLQGLDVQAMKDQSLGLLYLLLEGSRKDGKGMSCSCSWCNKIKERDTACTISHLNSGLSL